MSVCRSKRIAWPALFFSCVLILFCVHCSVLLMAVDGTLSVSDVVYHVRRVALTSGRPMFCVWVSLDPQYSINYSQSLSYADVARSSPASVVVINSTNASIHVSLSINESLCNFILCIIICLLMIWCDKRV